MDASPPRRRLFLAVTPEDGPPQLDEHELRHAAVLRLRPGADLLGLDGRGRAWPLRVLAASSRSVELEPSGAPVHEPAPGDAGSGLPHVTVALSLPRGGRIEDTVDRLTQLGVAAIAPFTSERTPPRARGFRPERLERAAREACKQSRRLWVPEVRELRALEELLDDCEQPAVRLDPAAPMRLADWCNQRSPLRNAILFVGPEGGFTPSEHARFNEHATTPAWLGPHVLRIETAAESAAALVLHHATDRASREQ